MLASLDQMGNESACTAKLGKNLGKLAMFLGIPVLLGAYFNEHSSNGPTVYILEPLLDRVLPVHNGLFLLFITTHRYCVSL